MSNVKNRETDWTATSIFKLCWTKLATINRHWTLDIGHWTKEDIGHWTLDKDDLAMRLGLKYVKGLSEKSGQAIVRARSESPFTSIDDLHQRVPELRKDELRKLAAVGALNFIQRSPMSNVQGPMSATQKGSDQNRSSL